MAMTRKQALEIAIASVQNDEALEILSKMLEQVSRPRTAAPSKSTARVENESIAAQLAESVTTGTEIDGAYIMNHTIAMTPQKVVGIMKVAVELGYFERNKVGKQVIYTRI